MITILGTAEIEIFLNYASDIKRRKYLSNKLSPLKKTLSYPNRMYSINNFLQIQNLNNFLNNLRFQPIDPYFINFFITTTISNRQLASIFIFNQLPNFFLHIPIIQLKVRYIFYNFIWRLFSYFLSLCMLACFLLCRLILKFSCLA